MASNMRAHTRATQGGIGIDEEPATRNPVYREEIEEREVKQGNDGR